MRVKHVESGFLTVNDFESVLGMNSQSEALAYLKSRGWDASDKQDDISSILKQKEFNLWNFVKELVGDLSLFGVILLKKDFTNLKAVLRGILNDIDVNHLLDPLALVKTDVLYNCVKKQNFFDLPSYISTVARESFEVLLQTGDACLCDAIIDAGMFTAMNSFNNKCNLKIAQNYIELLAVYSNINICVRSIRLKKNNKSFLSLALIPCRTFDLQNLLRFTVKGIDSLINYLNSVCYVGVPAFVYNESMENLVCWFDTSLYSLVKKERQCCFTLSPIFAFILANYLEFKNLRMAFNYFITKRNKEVLLARYRSVLA